MTPDTTYNGWTNYATWRVNLEILADIDLRDWFDTKPDTRDVADFLKEHVEDALDSEMDSQPSLAFSYAMAFVSDVNWHEIARAKLAEWQDYSDVDGIR
jgi:hypothetical protein